MKKENICKILYIISLFLIIVFDIKVGIDYSKYDPNVNSAPFYVFVIPNIVEFILPSIILFIVAKVLKKKCKE